MGADRRDLAVMATAREVVDDRDLVSFGDKAAGQVEADEPGAAEHQRPHAPALTVDR
jgi:hypothetical protein